MRVVVIGASGTIGSAVADQLAQNHEVVRASRSGEVAVDIADPPSIKGMFDKLGPVDAVVCCAGDAAFAPFEKLTDEGYQHSIQNKLMGQVNLVRFGIENVRDNGVFVLTAGIFATKPWPGVPAVAMVNGAVESFGRAAALDLPRGVRLNVVSPPFIKESADKMGIPDKGQLSAADNARYYVDLIEGTGTGQVVYPA